MEKRVQAGKTIMERRGWCIDPAIWRGRFCRLSVEPLVRGSKIDDFIPGYPF